MAVVSPDSVRPRVVIAGGGTGGVTIASWLRRLDPELDISLVEPSTSHHYQSGWVLVAGGFLPASETSRPQQEVLPGGVRWIHNRIQRFLPETNAVELLTGERLEYDVLIVALGLQLRWTAIPGLVDTLGWNGVTSIYSRRFAQATQRIFKDFDGGLALFTEPETAIKCGGAPQKILHLAHDQFSKRSGVGSNTHYLFCTAKPRLFPVPAYAERMAVIAADHGADIRLRHRLIAVDGPPHKATFAVEAEAGSIQTLVLPFDLLHVVPPMGAPDVVASSALATEASLAFVLAMMRTMTEAFQQRQEGLNNDLRQLASISQLPLDAIRCPTLIIHGDADADVPPGDARYAHHQIDSSQLHWIKGGSHLAFWIAPGAAGAQRLATSWLENPTRQTSQPNDAYRISC